MLRESSGALQHTRQRLIRLVNDEIMYSSLLLHAHTLSFWISFFPALICLWRGRQAPVCLGHTAVSLAQLCLSVDWNKVVLSSPHCDYDHPVAFSLMYESHLLSSHHVCLHATGACASLRVGSSLLSGCSMGSANCSMRRGPILIRFSTRT